MKSHITLGGDQHPVSYSNAVQYLYQQKFGRSLQGDFMAFAQASQAIMSGDVTAPIAEQLTNLAYIGIFNGYRQDGKKCPLEVLDVADLLLGDEKAIAEVVTMYAESLPKPSTDEGEKKTKPGATPAAKAMK